MDVHLFTESTVYRLPFTMRQQTDVEAGRLTGADVDVDDEGLESGLLDADAMGPFRELNHEPVLRLRPAPRFAVDGYGRIARLHAQRKRAGTSRIGWAIPRRRWNSGLSGRPGVHGSACGTGCGSGVSPGNKGSRMWRIVCVEPGL